MGEAELAIRELDFEAAAQLEPEGALQLIGSADGRVVSNLDSLVTRLHGQLIANGVRLVAVDIRRLEFMSASCFNVLVGWLSLINELAVEQRYQLRFATNPAVPWQRRSLHTLSCFATDLVKVT